MNTLEVRDCLETERVNGPSHASQVGLPRPEAGNSCRTLVQAVGAPQLIVPNDTICLKPRESAAALAPSNFHADNSVRRASKSKMLNQNSIDLSWLAGNAQTATVWELAQLWFVHTCNSGPDGYLILVIQEEVDKILRCSQVYFIESPPFSSVPRSPSCREQPT